MKKILLCPPTFYDIAYEINPWMHVENKVIPEKVKEEYGALKKVYEELGVEILEIPQVKGLPDMVYAANLGFPKGDSFIRANFKYDERKPEGDAAEKYFLDQGFNVYALPKDVSFEGQGDLLTAGGKYFFGWGKRSDYEAKAHLEEMLGAELLDFELKDPYFYHLDMSFAPLSSEIAVINPRSFTPDGLAVLRKLFSKRIELNEKDGNTFAGNLVVVDKTVVIGSGISDALKKEFAAHGFAVREVAMDEYRKGGGSVKCLTLEFYE